MQSVMKHQFSELPHVSLPRSSFNRSHGSKTTYDAGYLIPFYVDEALPGDTHTVRAHGITRMSTPLYPVMDNMFQDTFFFSVPLRLVWKNFPKFMGEQENPTDSTDYLIPQIVSTAITSNELGDYLGLPIASNVEASSLFFRAYFTIWNEWFRDQNLQNSIAVPTDDGPDNITTTGMHLPLRRGKRHDYFTSSLPWPQKGTAVDLPIGTSAPLNADGNIAFKSGAGVNSEIDASSGASPALQFKDSGMGGATNIEYHSGLSVDLSSATAATINQLRQAMQIQSMYEIDARSGTRYIEIIKGHFGVTSPDQRLQRPEYLGGGSTRINVNQVLNSSGLSSLGGQGLGETGAFATAEMHGDGFTKSFTEHCIIIGLVNVRADLTYQQGLNKMFQRKDKLDFYWPKLSQIGEQAVLNSEIFYQGTSADDDVFGYQERYAEYRYKPSTIHGDFRSDAAASLDAWHLSEDFSSLPSLNDSFIQDNPPISRVVRDSTVPQFIGDYYFEVTSARPMPIYGVPSDLTRF